jgi:hypothetical protein
VAPTTPMSAFLIFVDFRMRAPLIRPTPRCPRLLRSICSQVLMGFCAHLLAGLQVSCGYAGIAVATHIYL